MCYIITAHRRGVRWTVQTVQIQNHTQEAGHPSSSSCSRVAGRFSTLVLLSHLADSFLESHSGCSFCSVRYPELQLIGVNAPNFPAQAYRRRVVGEGG